MHEAGLISERAVLTFLYSSCHVASLVLQGLMVNEDSPIKRFYPEDFQTDLNGKEHDWEAVVLIPFIDEDQLMEAMQGHASSLLKEVGVCEYSRNCCLFNVGEFPNKILTLPIRYCENGVEIS